MRSKLDAMLKQLNDEQIAMSELCKKALINTISVLTNDDKVQAMQLIDNDVVINTKQRDIEHLALAIILHEQPVSSDLVQVNAASKMVKDFERIGDHIADINKIISEISFIGFSKEREFIITMLNHASKMLDNVMQAYTEQNVTIANNIYQQDDVLDKNLVDVKLMLIDHIKVKDDNDCAFDLYMLAKYIERIGDHICNIASYIKEQVS